MPLIALCGVLLLDAVQFRTGPHGIPVTGLLDEPAHLLTAGIVLAAVLGHRIGQSRQVVAVVLATSVLIDLDHVLLYAGVDGVAEGGRPFAHTPAAVVAVAGVGVLVPQAARRVALGVSAGMLLHLVRDISTGPGLPLRWPASTADVLWPYQVYATVLVGAALVAAVRLALRR